MTEGRKENSSQKALREMYWIELQFNFMGWRAGRHEEGSVEWKEIKKKQNILRKAIAILKEDCVNHEKAIWNMAVNEARGRACCTVCGHTMEYYTVDEIRDMFEVTPIHPGIFAITGKDNKSKKSAK